jgi:Small-conductance mechanosensitive channel
MRFRHFFRYLAVVALALTLAHPSLSADPDKDYRTTLANLLAELRQSYSSALESDSLLVNNPVRREQFAEMLHSADEVTIMLYTQRPELTFDMAFALENVERIHSSLLEQTRLSDKYRIASRSGLLRYTLLNETLQEMYRTQPADSTVTADSLRMLEPLHAFLDDDDPERKALLDSCVHYTGALAALYGESVAMALQDSVRIAETEQRLQHAYEYAQENYAESQKNRYIGGNVNIAHIVRNWKSFIRLVKDDLRTRYHTEPIVENALGAWSGRYVLTYAALSLVLLLLSFLLATLISAFIFKWKRLEKARPFRPILAAILAILLLYRGDPSRQVRPEQSLLEDGLPAAEPLLLADHRHFRFSAYPDSERSGKAFPRHLYAYLAAGVRVHPHARHLLAGKRGSAHPSAGPAAVHHLAEHRERPLPVEGQSDGPPLYVGVRRRNGRRRHSVPGRLLDDRRAPAHVLDIPISSPSYDYNALLLDEALLRRQSDPEESALPRRESVASAGGQERVHRGDLAVRPPPDGRRPAHHPRLFPSQYPAHVPRLPAVPDGSRPAAAAARQPGGYDFLTLSNLLLVVGLFFIFRYLIYLVKGLFRVFKLRGMIEKRGETTVPLKESDVNLSLSHTLITLLGWLLYLIVAFTILHIPTTTLTAISAGLAAGIGFALKDLINNFFYGIQLMAGRIRVGDKISCDGVRGIVKRVSYQTTQVEDEDGSLIGFTNTELFTKKFRNLNTGRNYEFLKMPVSVKYGTDIALARKVILEALEPLLTKDKAGRDIVDPSFPIDVRFDGFGDSCVNLIVALYTTVETHYTFPSRAKEAIYNAFYENGIEIPFPQRDLYVKTVPGKK